LKVTFMWPSNNSPKSNQWHHLMAPFKPYNFCLKYFFLKCTVYEIFDRSGTFWTPCIFQKYYKTQIIYGTYWIGMNATRLIINNWKIILDISVKRKNRFIYLNNTSIVPLSIILSSFQSRRQSRCLKFWLKKFLWSSRYFCTKFRVNLDRCNFLKNKFHNHTILYSYHRGGKI